MKKIIRSLVTFIAVIGVLISMPASAYADILPENQMRNSASDFGTAAYIVNEETGEEILCPVIEETVSSNESVQSTSEGSVTKTIHVLVPVPEDGHVENIYKGSAEINGSQTGSRSDSSGSYNVTLTINYSTYYDSSWGSNMYLLTGYSATWTQLDRQVSASNKYVICGCNGFRPNVSGQNKTIYATGSYVSGNTGFGQYISDNVSGNSCGASASATLKRVGSNSTWNLYLTNNIVYSSTI